MTLIALLPLFYIFVYSSTHVLATDGEVYASLGNLRRRSSLLIGDGNYNQYGSVVDDSNIGDVCGYSIDLSNDGRTLLVGCPHTQVGDNEDAGSAVLYRLITDETGASGDSWTRAGVAIKGLSAEGHLGMSVSISSNNVIMAVGEPMSENQTGRVKIYRIGGDYLQPNIDQIGDDILGSAVGDRFGIDIDLSGDGSRIVIGADQKNNGSGFADVYTLENNQWNLLKRFQSDSDEEERFGIAVSISEAGDRIGVGAIGVDTNDDVGRKNGRAIVYDVASGSILRMLVGQQNVERLGRSIALSPDGKTVAVGSIRHNCFNGPANCGRVQVVDIRSGEKVGNTNSDIFGTEFNERCGRSVDISNFSEDTGTVVIGCLEKVLVGTLTDSSSFTVEPFTNPNNSDGVSEFFGTSVSLSNVRQAFAVGAPGPKDIPNASITIGNVYTFGSPEEATRSPSSIPSTVPSTSQQPTFESSPTPTALSTTEVPTRPPQRPTRPTPPPIDRNDSKGKGGKQKGNKSKGKGKKSKGKGNKSKGKGKKSKGKGKKSKGKNDSSKGKGKKKI